MRDLLAFLQATVEWVSPSKKTEAPKRDAEGPMVGKYRANYSPLTDDIALDDSELAELYANSRPVSR